MWLAQPSKPLQQKTQPVVGFPEQLFGARKRSGEAFHGVAQFGEQAASDTFKQRPLAEVHG